MLVRRYRFIRVARSAALALCLTCAFDAYAQQATLSNARGLDFGRFVAAGGGTVTLSPSGLRSRTGAVVLLASPGVGQAVFNVGRTGNGRKTTIAITLPSNGNIVLTSGTNSMAVSNFVSTPTSPMPAPLLGAASLSVGATLNVAPNQTPGTYSGTFSVTVNYQ